MERLVNIAANYVKTHPIHKQVNDPHVTIVSNLKAFETISYLTLELPLDIAEFM